MDKPSVAGLVSIITPTYNAAAFIAETIESVRGQTYGRWEWLIADDGSTDLTTDIVARAMEADDRVRLIGGDRHCGVAASVRNRALAEARGEFIAFLDADDLWHAEKLVRQTDYLAEHSRADGVCCPYNVIGDTKSVDKARRMLRRETAEICSRKDVLRGCPFQTSTVLFRRQCYDETGGMDEDPRLRATEDTEYFARLIDRYEFHRMPETLASYRVGRNSYTNEIMDADQSPGWRLFEVMCEKGFYTVAEARRKKSRVFYEQAKDNLFHVGGPFRRYLVRSLLSGHAPAKAYAMLVLSFLPASAVRSIFIGAGGVMWRWRAGETGSADV